MSQDRNSTTLDTGSAAAGQMGPSIGLMSIYESEISYLFHVALPGVKSGENDFSCDVDTDGRVDIKGVITKGGEESVELYSRTFVMLSRNLGPPGGVLSHL